MTLDDEMNNPSINTGLGLGTTAAVRRTGAVAAPKTTAAVLRAADTSSKSKPQQPRKTALNTAGIFSQHYGYFQAQGQSPNDNGGIGDGVDPTFSGFLTGVGKDAGTGFT